MLYYKWSLVRITFPSKKEKKEEEKKKNTLKDMQEKQNHLVQNEEMTRKNISVQCQDHLARLYSKDRELLHRLVHSERAAREASDSEQNAYSIRHRLYPITYEQQVDIDHHNLVCGAWRRQYLQIVRERVKEKQLRVENFHSAAELKMMKQQDSLSLTCEGIRRDCCVLLREFTYVIFGPTRVSPDCVSTAIRFVVPLFEEFQLSLASIRDEFDRDLGELKSVVNARLTAIHQMLAWTADEEYRLREFIRQDQAVVWRLEILRTSGIELERTTILCAMTSRRRHSVMSDESILRQSLISESCTELQNVFGEAVVDCISALNREQLYARDSLLLCFETVKEKIELDVAFHRNFEKLVQKEVRQRGSILWAQDQTWVDLCQSSVYLWCKLD